jgi:hypothetical protein
MIKHQRSTIVIGCLVLGIFGILISVLPAVHSQESDLPSVLDDAQKSLKSKMSNGSKTSPPGAQAVNYKRYTSDKYGIQFLVPPNWTVKEKANRFDEGSDIRIKSPETGCVFNCNKGVIAISRITDLIDRFGALDLDSIISTWGDKNQMSDYSTEYREVQSPLFMNIGGERTGTVVYTTKNKIGNPDPLAVQDWLTFVGQNGYFIEFMASPDTFDSPENTEAREQIIKSIRFTNSTLN